MIVPRFARIALTVAFLGLTLTACDSSEVNGPDPGIAPEVLPPSAFSIADDAFPDNSNAARFGSGANHANAAIRVGLVTLAVGVHLIVPSAATQAATQVTPFVENGVWIWENTVLINGQNVTFRLEGAPDGAEIDWDMIISAANLNGATYDEFTLYTATTAIDGSTGAWSLFYRIDGQSTRVLGAVYDETSSTAREITFSVPETNPDQSAHGASVRYAADQDMRLFDWQEATPGQTALIEWDEDTHVGYIEAWNYNNGERACWDENLDDVDCVGT